MLLVTEHLWLLGFMCVSWVLLNIVLLHQGLFFLAPDFSRVSGDYNSQRLVLPVKEWRKEGTKYLVFFITLVSSSSSLHSTGATFSLVFLLLFIYSHNPFFLSFVRFNSRSALAFQNPLLHDLTTFAEQLIHATSWHSGTTFQGWSRLLKDFWGTDSATCLCYQFLNLIALTVKTCNYLQKDYSSI